MSKTNLTAAICLIILSLSCDPNKGNTEPSLNIPEGTKESLVFEYLIHDVEGIVFNMFHSLHERDQGEANTHIAFNVFEGRGACANQTLNTAQNELVLDFSFGCIDDSERLRSGIIEINYTNPDDEIGNVIVIQLDQFRINNIGLSGGLTIENVSTVSSDNIKDYSISFNDLALNINSEISHFTGNRQIHYEKVDGNVFETTELNYLTSSNLSFELENGTEFEVSTPTATSHAFYCWLDYFYFPISGNQFIETGNYRIEIDYNTGSCNYSFNLTESGAEPQIFDLNAIL